MNVRIFIVLVLFGLCGLASAKTIYVPDDYAKIQWAVDNATAGDTIIVRDGVYYENVYVDKSLTIMSENGSANCVVHAANSNERVSIHKSLIKTTSEHLDVKIWQTGNKNEPVPIPSPTPTEVLISKSDLMTSASTGHVFNITADNVSIVGFTVKGAWWPHSGIYISGVNSCSVRNCMIEENGQGVVMEYSSGNIIVGNTIQNNWHGIVNMYSCNNTIRDNIILNCNGSGIGVFDSIEITIINNTFENNGIAWWGDEIRDSNTHTIENNTINGKPIYYYKDSRDLIVPKDAGQVILGNCTNITIKNVEVNSANDGIILAFTSNCTVEDSKIANNVVGIKPVFSSNVMIENCTLENNWWLSVYFWASNGFVRNNSIINGGPIHMGVSSAHILKNIIMQGSTGIHLYYSSNNLVERNTIDGGRENGILLYYASNNKILENIITNCYQGMYVEYSSNNCIERNEVERNNYGNSMGIVLNNSNNNIISENNISVNLCGLELRHSSNNKISKNSISNGEAGIALFDSNNNAVLENNISSIMSGISLDSSSNNAITNNAVSNSGIDLWYSSNNTIYLNNFINNQVYSYNSTNIWNSTEKITYTYNGKQYTNYLGNYWSDYNGSDADGDGIGDTPYSIDGDEDNYPLMERFENYTFPEPTAIYVPDDYAKIQWAIDNATAGDTIIVRDGVYYENVVIDKSLTLKSENGSASCILDASGEGDVIAITADGATLEGFTVKNGSTGIKITSNNNVISNNTITSNTNSGIYLQSSSGNIIISNTVAFNNYGIYLSFSSNNTIANNIVKNNYHGIHLESLSNTTAITNNIIENNTYGVYLLDSISITLSNNTMIENSIYIFGNSLLHYNTHEIYSSNTVNGKPVYYLKNQSEVRVPEGAGQIILANCSDILVENQILNNASVGIEIAYSSNVTVNNNSVENTIFGIYLYYSSSNTICNNTLKNNFYSIWLQEYSSNNIIASNIISSSTDEGIRVWYHSNNNTITNNYIAESHMKGIFLWYWSKYNVISNNTIENNWYGIYLWSANNNTIYSNNFINNTDNAYSHLSTNIWNSPEKITYIYNGQTFTNYLGNYWDDYNGTDSDGDGIGDTPYLIDEDADYYPLMEPWENYFVPPQNQPPVASFTFTPESPEVGDTITFNASLSYDPDGYITSYEWSFGDGNVTTTDQPVITHIYSSAGDYTVTLTVTDDKGAKNSTSKTISVTSASVTVNISLAQGWNLISLPVSDAILDIPSSVVQYAYWYDPQTQSYEYVSITEIEPGKGYWVAAISDCNITATGIPLTEYSVNLTQGWNMIGSLIVETDFSSPNTTPPNSVLPYAHWYDPVTQSYPYTTILEPTKGYWVAAVNDCTLYV